MRVCGVVGWKNAGKTGLVERLIAELAARGLTVATVKHAHHDADIDRPGTDSHRHRAAGAREVLLASPRRWALMHELADEAEPALDAHIARLSPADVVLVEGFKRERHAKIEVHRAVTGRPLLAPDDPTIRAVVSDVAHPGLDRLVLDPAATGRIAEVLLAEGGT